MAGITPPDYTDPKACSTEKLAHQLCFSDWMKTKFLVGKAEKDDCENEWQKYHSCVEVSFST